MERREPLGIPSELWARAGIRPPCAGRTAARSATPFSTTAQRPLAQATRTHTGGCGGKRGGPGQPAHEALTARKAARTTEASSRTLPKGAPSAQIAAGKMQYRLRACAAVWATFASALVMGWVTDGFPFQFDPDKGAPPPFAGPNHNSALAEADFVTDQVSELLAAGTIMEWSMHGHGNPHIVTPLGVVHQNGKKRLIFDARHLNQYLHVPKFKYEDLSVCGDYLQQEDYMITLDLSKGYHHMDVHPSFWTFLGFEWQGVYYVYTSEQS